MEETLAVAFGYLLGSVPFAHVLTRGRGIDLRHVGSGNVGAANVLRTSGLRRAVVAVSLDALKGALAVIAAQRLAIGSATTVAAGLASVIGHVYPIWLGFRGGKGVATAAGVFGVLAPWALTAAAIVFTLTLWATRYVSAGSLAGALTLTVVAAAGAPLAVGVGAALAAILIVHRHRGNLARLMAGTERRVGQRLL